MKRILDKPESSRDGREDRSGWALCEACGHWQRSAIDSSYSPTVLAKTAGCELCGWQTTVAPGRAVAGSALRFLLEVEARSDGTWQVVALRSARLSMVAGDDRLLQALQDDNGPIRHLHVADHGRIAFPTMERWHRSREEVTGLVSDLCNERIRASWPAPETPRYASAIISFRCLVLIPEIETAEVQEEFPSWLHFVPFDAAAADAAAALDDDDVLVDCEESIVRLGDGGDRIRVSLRSVCELLVDGYAVVCESSERTHVVWRSDQAAIAYRDVLSTLPSIRLPAEALRGLALNPENCKVQVRVRGRGEPFQGRLAVGDLPARTHVADLLLDLGSTTTKWALCFRNDARCEEYFQDTESLVRAWGVPRYVKSELVSDTSGRKWTAWLAQALPRLRYWVGHEHGAYLARVFVSLPSTSRFDVAALSSEIRSREHRRLSIAIDSHLIDGGCIILKPEHEFLARHYLDVLRALHNVAESYKSKFNTEEALRAAEKRQLDIWRAMYSKREAYDSRSWLERTWKRFWNREPDDPGTRPKVRQNPTALDEWMLELLRKPDQLDRVMLLDAGGLSLDVAVFEGSQLNRELSRSMDSCGGEELSRCIGRQEDGDKGTRYKAGLGRLWHDARDPNDKRQQEYINATRCLYEPDLRSLVAALYGRWQRSGPCIVILTGGGSRNPHLGEMIEALFSRNNLQSRIIDGPIIQDMLTRARRFPESLRGLEPVAVARFEQTQSWSERRERNRWAQYDKFAVVGGMLAIGAGDDE